MGNGMIGEVECPHIRRICQSTSSRRGSRALRRWRLNRRLRGCRRLNLRWDVWGINVEEMVHWHLWTLNVHGEELKILPSVKKKIYICIFLDEKEGKQKVSG